MKTPRKKIIGLALLLVVITIGVTSPLLTMLATLLQQDAAADPVLSTQLLSLLGGHWGNVVLQTEVATSASLILAFASNTAVIGAYHVFLALARMEFFPEFILKRNRFRGTPHWSIALATGIPIAVLRLDFWLGLLTTLLVMLAWSISIISQPLATAFGCSVALAGLAVAYVNYVQGRAPVVTLYLEGRMPDSLLAVLTAGDERNDAVIDAAITNARGKPVVFLYLAEPKAERVPRLFEVVEPHLEDEPAKDTLKQAALRARKARLASRFVYRPQAPGSAGRIRYELTPRGKIAHLLKHW